jgi:uncharacterized protein YukE
MWRSEVVESSNSMVARSGQNWVGDGAESFFEMITDLNSITSFFHQLDTSMI